MYYPEKPTRPDWGTATIIISSELFAQLIHRDDIEFLRISDWEDDAWFCLIASSHLAVGYHYTQDFIFEHGHIKFKDDLDV